MSSVDVVVIGAGFAGLSAALDLVKKGLTVKVLEARVRLGGRCQTGNYKGEAFDVGGHWISSIQPRVMRMLGERGFHTKDQYDDGLHVMRLRGQHYEYNGNISTLSALGDKLAGNAAMIAQLDADMALVPLDDPSKCPKAAEWDNMTLREWQLKNLATPELIQLNDYLVWTVCTKRAEELSYLSYLVYVKQGHGYAVLSDIRGGAQEKKCVGGLMQVCERLAAEIGTQHVLLRTPVKAIEQDARGCTVVTSSGARHSCRRVICTAPPACLEDIKFQPDLPAPMKLLNAQNRPGVVIKLYVIYKRNWWRPKGLSGEMLSDEEPTTLYYDATTEKVPAFIGFICGHLAKKWSAVPVDELKRAVVEQLVREYGPDARDVEHIVVRPWMEDDVWCKGAYSGTTSPGVVSKYGAYLRTPVGRIHWAGTERALDWSGYFEGAIESGQRVASEVIQELQGERKLAKL